MVVKFVRCPVCGDSIEIVPPEDLVEKADRLPARLEVDHKDHKFYVFFDSSYRITEILKEEDLEG